MYFKLSEKFETMSVNELGSYADFFETLFTAHRLGFHIIIAKRKLLLKIRELLGISGRAKATIDQISNKLNEYYSASSTVRRIIICSPPEPGLTFRLEDRDVVISIDILNEHHLLQQKFLLTENLTDGSIVIALSEVFLKSGNYPINFIAYRAIGGGGNTLADALREEANNAPRPKGLAFCDSDGSKNPPPFIDNTTAWRAFAIAAELNLVNQGIGLSLSSPFFAFDVTRGHSIENYIGPNLLECYFNALNRRTERLAFMRAFPNFPKLSALEITIWMSLNLKIGTTSLKGVFDLLRRENGSVPPQMLARHTSYIQLSFPGDVLAWIITNSKGRWQRPIENAVRLDLKYDAYLSSIEHHANLIRDICAGDTSARQA